MYDIKFYEDGREKETIRGLYDSQIQPLKEVLKRHGVKHSVKRIEQSAQRTGRRCPACGSTKPEGSHCVVCGVGE